MRCTELDQAEGAELATEEVLADELEAVWTAGEDVLVGADTADVEALNAIIITVATTAIPIRSRTVRAMAARRRVNR